MNSAQEFVSFGTMDSQNIKYDIGRNMPVWEQWCVALRFRQQVSQTIDWVKTLAKVLNNNSRVKPTKEKGLATI